MVATSQPITLTHQDNELCVAIQFTRSPPRFSGILFTSVAEIDAPVLCADIAVLLAKDAIEPVPPAEIGRVSTALTLHCTEKRWWDETNPRPARSKC